MRTLLLLSAAVSLVAADAAFAQRAGSLGADSGMSRSGTGSGAPLGSPGALPDPSGMGGSSLSGSSAGAIGAPGLGSVTGGADIGPSLRAGSTGSRRSGLSGPGAGAPTGAPTVNGGNSSPGATPNASGANPGGPGATPDSLRTTPGGPGAGPGAPLG